MNKISLSLIFIASLFITACSNDDEPSTPNTAVAINMMAGDDETTIGGSDVYINPSLNFTSDYCGISDLGKRGGLGKNPVISQLVSEVAVSPGNNYQIIRPQDLGTVADMRVFAIHRSYYNVYVESWIYGRDKEIAGTKVKYAECYPVDKDLPEWDSTISVKFRDNDGYYTATYSFPKGCAIDDNIIVFSQNGYEELSDALKFDIAGNRIKFEYPKHMSYPWPGEAVLLVRHESLYTRVHLTLKYPD